MKQIRIANFELEIPDHLNVIDQESITSLFCLEDNHLRIIAIGVDPRDGKVTLITASGDIRIFDAKSEGIPSGDYVPTPDGLHVILPNENNRWPESFSAYRVQAKWLIEKSVSGFDGMSISLEHI